MDKLMNTPWFIKIVALSLAALLYISVNFDPDSSSAGLGFSTPAKIDTEVIEDVPVELYYDRENLVVTGAPETVDVSLKGPKSLLLSAKNNRDFKVYIDLSDPEIELGRKQVPIKIRDINDKLKVTIEPAYANVSIQEKITKEFTVEPEFNRSLLEEGYLAEEPIVQPQKVKITGAKDIIETISYVKATVELNGPVNDTVYRQAMVRALDREFNKLDVLIEPSVVDVKVPIKSPSKTVSIHPVQTGTPKEGIKIKSIHVEPKEVSLFGKKSILDSIEKLEVPFDVSEISNTTEVTIPLKLPEGIKAASAEEVRIVVEIEKEKENETDDQKDAQQDDQEQDVSQEKSVTKTFSNIKIIFVGLLQGYKLDFVSPKQGAADVTISGKSEDINHVKASDLQLSINVEGLEEGEHVVPLQLKTPTAVKGSVGVNKALINITKASEET
ncbi:YbbR-like domain-containing protein [Peribacillus tepidiphilus]|uniref:CdaR family protein n=1 Tax=Peribacillus tepidiphilus TaxID=2652445 RepID=UPI0012926D90|nr:CdaR family protein [Peribacillus tepidiphilus]